MENKFELIKITSVVNFDAAHANMKICVTLKATYAAHKNIVKTGIVLA